MKKLIAVLLSIAILASCSSVKVNSKSTSLEEAEAFFNDFSQPELTESEADSSNITSRQKDALLFIKECLSVSSFSYDFLVAQLEYEGFTTEEAIYAADNCGADWYEQAEKEAKLYLERKPYTKEEMIEFLEIVGFTKEQAIYGAVQNGL